MNMWIMYLVLILDNIQLSAEIIFIVFLILIALFIILIGFYKIEEFGDDNSEKIKYFAKNSYRLIIISAILLVIMCFVPTTKQAAAIYFVPKVIANKQVRKMPDKLVTLANAWMDEQIKSIKTTK